MLTDSLDLSTSLVAGTLAITQGTTSVAGLTINATIGTLSGGANVNAHLPVLVGTLAAGDYEPRKPGFDVQLELRDDQVRRPLRIRWAGSDDRPRGCNARGNRRP